MEVAYPQVGVGALIVDDANRVLLMLRNKAPEANHWSITGGRVEFMEPLERAIVREVKEELDLDVVVDELLCVTNHILPDERAHWVAPAFLVRVINGQISNREPGTTRRIQFFPLDALPSNLTLTAGNAIKAYCARYHLEARLVADMERGFMPSVSETRGFPGPSAGQQFFQR